MAVNNKSITAHVRFERILGLDTYVVYIGELRTCHSYMSEAYAQMRAYLINNATRG